MMTANLFSQLLQPLDYAESLLEWFSRLGVESDESVLPGSLVDAAAQLSQCPLSQLYLTGEGDGQLALVAQHWHETLPPAETFTAQADYRGQQVLQFALDTHRALSVRDLQGSLYDVDFLPTGPAPWQSLLCVPLIDSRKKLSALLLCASDRPVDLHGYSPSLQRLGDFALSQLMVLRRVYNPGHAVSTPVSAPDSAGFGLIGSSAAMDETCRLMSKVLDSTCTVLLQGETGTGKEVVARAIHMASARRSKAFVVQNCAAFPEGLLESELFGYCKGAFTGADRDRPGLFDTAHGGTLLLDEIGDMPVLLQAKLLRVLQEGEIRPLGARRAHSVDVRIIAATHRDLTAMVAQGSFREDLYYRLAQFPIELPALRERDGDVLALARHFAGKACASQGRPPVRWSDTALDQLAGHAFPGNVRELKCLVERAVLLCDDELILPQHLALPQTRTAPDTAATLRQRMERVERGLLIDCLRKNRGNRTRAARELGVARRTLLYRLARLKIPLGEAMGEQ